MNLSKTYFRKRYLYNFLLIINCLVIGCSDEKRLSGEHSAAESVELFFHEDYDVTWAEVAELIHILSASGHNRILVNNTRINLPPRVPLYDSVPESDRLRIHIGEGDEQEEVQHYFSSSSLDELKKLIDNKTNLSVISLSFDADCSIDDVVIVMQLLNSSRVPFTLVKP